MAGRPPQPTEGTQRQGDGYHHGDLPAALRQATAELVSERGPAGFSLREVARRSGVSHAAVAHHFNGARGLLTSVALEGFQRLSQSFADIADEVPDPVERMTAMGKAYIDVALRFPGHFAVMWSEDLVDGDDPELQAEAGRSYEFLLECITDLAAAHNPELDVATAATMTWSLIHGLAELSHTVEEGNKPEIRPDGDLDPIIEQFTVLMMDGYRAR